MPENVYIIGCNNQNSVLICKSDVIIVYYESKSLIHYPDVLLIKKLMPKILAKNDPQTKMLKICLDWLFSEKSIKEEQ
jgi:hypothetical protein